MMSCRKRITKVQKRRAMSLPTITDCQNWKFNDVTTKKSHGNSKIKIEDDFYLSDQTVPADDPRIIDALESINRIRDRTGFDPNLMKDKLWSNRICKDLIQGLARVDDITLEKKRRELTFVRNIEAERIMLNRRLEQLSKNLVRTSLHRQRSKSLGCINSNLAAAYSDLNKSVMNLKSYISYLEEQGGFSLEIKQIRDDVFVSSYVEQRSDGNDDSISLPSLKETVDCSQSLEKDKIVTIRRHLIKKPGGTRILLKVRSPSLPSIPVKVNSTNGFKDKFSSVSNFLIKAKD